MRRRGILIAAFCIGTVFIFLYWLFILDFYKDKQRNYVKSHPELTREIKAAIMNRELVIGMTDFDVVASMGPPLDINRNNFGSIQRTEFIYSPISHYNYVYFENGRVISWTPK